MKVAVVHDWLVTFGGAERVLEQVLRCFPDADLFSLIDFLPADQRNKLGKKKTKTSFIQRLPFARKYYRRYLPLMPLAVERLDLSDYQLVISISHAVAKGVLTSADQLHICYLQARNLKYAYDDRGMYPHGRLSGFLEDYFLHKVRLWDASASHRPNRTISNSLYVSKWHYHRHRIQTDIIYPPVDVEHYSRNYSETKKDYFLTVGRLEPYKRTDLIVQAFNELGYPLIIAGSGTEMERLKKMAKPNISFLGFQSKQEIADLTRFAKAFVFAACEDFGIAPLEAQASGTPIIAFGKGGALETIRGLESTAPTGVFFDSQDVEGLISGVETFLANSSKISPEACRANALRFSEGRFREEFESYVAKCLKEFFGSSVCK